MLRFLAHSVRGPLGRPVGVLLAAASLWIAPSAQAQIALRAAASGVAVTQIGVTPSHVASSTGSTAASGATSITITTPSGAATDDVLVAQITLGGAIASITAPSGWTLIDRSSSATAGSEVTQAVYWHAVTAGEPASHAWSWVGTARGAGGIAAYRNSEAVDPVDSWGVRINNATGTITLPNLTTTSDNTLLVAALGSSSSSSHTAPSGMTERYDSATGAGPNGVTASSASQLQAAVGTTGTKTATGPVDDNIAHLVALRADGALTINLPSGTVANDLMIASVALRPCSGSSGAACTTSVTPPAGWTLVRQSSATAGGGTDGYGSRLFVYRRLATASEPSSYTWFFGGTPVHAGAAGGILSFSGVDSINPIVAENGQASASGNSHATPSISTGTVTNVMLVSSHSGTSSARWTPPGGMTERVDVASRTAPDDLGVSLEVNTETRAAAGATGTRTATQTAPAPAADTGATHLLALRPAVVGPDHYELSLSSGSISCLPTTVTVTACADASSPCTSAHTAASGSSANLATSAGTLAATTLTFGASGSASTTLSHPAAGNGTAVAVSLSGESSAATNPRQCCPNGSSCSAASSCSTTFNTAGFIVSATAGGVAATIPTQVAGTAASTHYLRAVQTSTSTQACEAALSGSTAVSWAYQCNNPTSCSGSDLMSVNGGSATTVQRNNNTGVSSYTSVTMTFDANGNAPFTFTFGDVGRATLWATKTVNSATLNGTSNAFVTRPAGFTVSGIAQTASPFLANPAAASAGGARFVKAGENFGASVTARTSTGAATPNYGKETVPEGVLLSHALVLPGGGAAGTLSNASVAGTGFSNGAASVSNLAWDEVGIITLTPAVADGDYLGAGNVTGTSSGNVGRFIPDHFSITQGTPSPACSNAFTYFGQDGFTTPFVLKAENLANATTQNYSGSFALLGLTTWNNFGFSAAGLPSGSALSASATAPTGSWSSGLASVSARHQVSRPGALAAETAVIVRAAPVDSDGVGMAAAPVGAATALRFGRLRLSNAFGSEKTPLQVPVQAQYWSGKAWVPNSADSCTTVPAAAVVRAAYVDNKGAATAAWSSSVAAIVVSAGNGVLGLGVPTPAATGSVDIALNLGTSASDQSCLGAHPTSTGAALPWLRSQNGSCSSAWDRDPSARASFGIYAPETRKTVHVREIF